MALTAKKVYAVLKRQISDMEAKLNSPVRYRGTVATADLLPLNPDIGDMYNIESKSVYGEAGMNVAWNGVVWDTMGAPIDMSLYLTKEEAETVIQRLVTEYFEKNPVKPGATTEQAAQIEQNKVDIASLKTETSSLKEDMSNKITKFYASNQGETHLADSDNGKITDMVLYGRSEQKRYSGKNLLNATLQTTTVNGVTCTANGDGTYTLNGTATDIAIFVVYYNFADVYGSASSLKMVGCPSGGSAQKYFLRSYRKGGNPEILDEYGSGISIGSFKEAESNIAILVKSGVTVNNLIFKPMLTTDTTATYADFEPYTGGIPSPNPDYPQEIKSVVNPTVKVCGKNLFNKESPEKSGYIIAQDGTLEESEGFNIYIYKYIDKPYTISYKKGKAFDAFRYGIESNGIITRKNEITSPFTVKLNKGERLYLSPHTNESVVYDIQIELGSTSTTYEPYHEQTVTLPYTLNAIPVSSGGNVTIDGQQYVADYVDVERGKLVRMVGECIVDGTEKWRSEQSYMIADISNFNRVDNDNYMTYILCDKYRTSTNTTYDNVIFARKNGDGIVIKDTSHQSAVEDWKKYLNNNPCIVHHLLITPTEIDLTPEEIAAFKALATYYPITNISVNSEQLDGYTVFNYPISMANGWNYVKKQLNDNRDYIYDMDIQSAEAYVNSEYAVALTELEV